MFLICFFSHRMFTELKHPTQGTQLDIKLAIKQVLCTFCPQMVPVLNPSYGDQGPF